MALKVIKEPKITVNKLGEFLVAPAKRQRTILEQIKYPNESTYGVAPYGDVKQAIRNYLISDFDDAIISTEIRAQQTKLKNKGISDWSKSIVGTSIEALEKVLDFEFDCDEFTFQPYEGTNPKVMIHGVEVSINPDLLVFSTIRKKDYCGAMKIHISKTSKSDEDSCSYVATLLNNFSMDHLSTSEVSNRHQNSISYDVFKDIFMESPKSFKRKMDDIEAGCMNIKAIWDSI